MEILIEVDKPIGTGAQGSVWLAKDPMLPRLYAVKFFDQALLERHADAVIEQARALSAVDHPALVRLYSLEKQSHPVTGNSELALIMAYCDGEALDRVQELTARHAGTVARDLCDAIEAIHAAGLSHSDLHERNVLVVEGGARVIDLANSRSFDWLGNGSRTSLDDLKDLGDLLARVLKLVPGADVTRIQQAVAAARTSRSVGDVRRAFSDIVVSLRRHPLPPERRMSDFRCRNGRDPTVVRRAASAGLDHGAWAPDGTALAVWSSAPSAAGIAWLWDFRARSVRGGAELRDDGRQFDLVAWSSSSSRLVVSSYDRFAILRAVDAEVLYSGTAFVLYDQIALSPDGELFAWMTAYGDVGLAASDGTMVHRAQVHPGVASFSGSISWAPDGNCVLIAERQMGAQLWSRTGNLLGRLLLPGDPELGQPPVTAWSADGARIASCSEKGVVGVFDGATGWPLDSMGSIDTGDAAEGSRRLAWVGQYLCVSGPRSTGVWNLGDQTPIRILELDHGGVDGTSLYQSRPDGPVALLTGDSAIVLKADGRELNKRVAHLPYRDLAPLGWSDGIGLWLIRQQGVLVSVLGDEITEYRMQEPVRSVAVGSGAIGIGRGKDYVVWEPGAAVATTIRPGQTNLQMDAEEIGLRDVIADQSTR